MPAPNQPNIALPWVLEFDRNSLEGILIKHQEKLNIKDELEKLDVLIPMFKDANPEFPILLDAFNEIQSDLVFKILTCKLALGVLKEGSEVSMDIYDVEEDLNDYLYVWKFILNINLIKQSLGRNPTTNIFKFIFGFNEKAEFDVIFGATDDLVSLIKNPRVAVNVDKNPRVVVA
jgi:hypothetical protein